MRKKNPFWSSQNYKLNPNFLTDYKAYTLGIPPEAFDKLQAYRSENKFVNSAAAFQEINIEILSELFVNSPNKHKRLKLYLY